MTPAPRMPKRECPTCLRKISYTNFSRHLKFQHSYCDLCGECHSLKKHRRKAAPAVPQQPSLAQPQLSQFVPLLVPVYFPIHVYRLLLRVGGGEGWVRPLAEQIHDWMMDENRRNCRACDGTHRPLSLDEVHTCCQPPPTDDLISLYFDKVCRDHSIHFPSLEMYQQLRFDVQLAFYEYSPGNK